MSKVRSDKLVFTDKDGIEHVYLIKVDAKCSKAATDVLTKGLVIGYKVGVQVYKNPLGEPSGMAAKGFNSTKPRDCGRLTDMSSISNVSYEQLLLSAIRRSAQVFKATDAKSKPPLLIDPKYKNKIVHFDDGKFHIHAHKFCAGGCGAEIKGKHELFVTNGKVSQETPFILTDTTVTAVEGKTGKWLCSVCAIKTTNLIPSEKKVDAVATNPMWPTCFSNSGGAMVEVRFFGSDIDKIHALIAEYNTKISK